MCFFVFCCVLIALLVVVYLFQTRYINHTQNQYTYTLNVAHARVIELRA